MVSFSQFKYLISISDVKFLSLFTIFTFLVGCSFPKVEAWDKQFLAKKEMALEIDRLENRNNEHVYFSREGTSSSWSIGGGGCGCN